MTQAGGTRFGAANYEAEIFFNKKCLGFHHGRSKPFFIEVTDLLLENNRILAVVDNTMKA